MQNTHVTMVIGQQWLTGQQWEAGSQVLPKFRSRNVASIAVIKICLHVLFKEQMATLKPTGTLLIKAHLAIEMEGTVHYAMP